MTEKTKHTPGPWTAHDDDGTGTLPCVLSKQVTSFGNFYVAQCNVFEDARLVAAAPEMLETFGVIDEYCQMGLNSDDSKHWEAALRDIMQTVRAVIKKAKGE
jgi:hypothetical protein